MQTLRRLLISLVRRSLSGRAIERVAWATGMVAWAGPRLDGTITRAEVDDAYWLVAHGRLLVRSVETCTGSSTNPDWCSINEGPRLWIKP